MTPSQVKTEHIKEAKQYLKDRIADFKKFNKLSMDWDDQPSKADEKVLEELGSPHDYGLSLEKESYHYKDELYTWQYQLSTGGPGDEFTFMADKFGEDIQGIKFVFLPWFDRVELELNLDQEAVVREFISKFLYLEVDEEREN